MTRYKKAIISSFLFLGIGLMEIHAQETITATGGIASGSGGSASYSVGLIISSTATGTNGSTSAGGQQPYEISTVTEIKEAGDVNLIYSTYPNPTSDFLTLRIENNDQKKLCYQLFDINGKLIENKKTESNETRISLINLVPATYILKVTKNNEEVKTFKIVKN